MVQRLQDIHEIKNLMGGYEYLHVAGMHDETAELFALKTPGVKAEMVWGAYENFRRASKHDQMISERGGVSLMSPGHLIDQFYSKGPDAGNSGVNDPVYDAIRDDKFWAAKDQAEAKAAFMEADKRVIEQHWGVWMLEADYYNCWQPYLKGYSSETALGITWARLWIDQELKK